MSRGLGILQRRAMLYLWRARPSGSAEVREVKRAMGSDRANNRRAIRTLLDRGLLKEVTGEDGERLVALTSGAWDALTLAEIFAREPGALSEEQVPSEPFDVVAVLASLGEDHYDYGTLLRDWNPHEPQEPPWLQSISEIPVTANARSPHGSEIPSWFGVPSGEPLLSDNLGARSERPHGKQVTPWEGEASFKLPLSDNDARRQPSAMQRVLDALTEGLEEMGRKDDE